MVLTVVVPDNRPGMQLMLSKELQNIDSEIIYDNWRSGLKKAQGDFICLLEFDSAVSPGSIARQLEPFLNNPRFRKLAMVSPMIEFDDSSAPMVFQEQDGSITLVENHKEYPQLTRVGSIAGSVIRRSSLMQRTEMLKRRGIMRQSLAISLDFWDNGLRLMYDPQALYYCPDSLMTATIPEFEISEATASLWQRECIA